MPNPPPAPVSDADEPYVYGADLPYQPMRFNAYVAWMEEQGRNVAQALFPARGEPKHLACAEPMPEGFTWSSADEEPHD